MRSRPKAIFLFTACIVLLFAGVGLYGQRLVRFVLPLHHQMLLQFAPDAWEIASLEIVREGRESFIRVRAVVRSPFYLGGQPIAKGTAMRGATLLGHAMQPVLIMLAVLLGWFFFAGGRIAGPVLMLIPMLVVVEAVDVPLVLTGSLWDLLHANFAPHAPLPWQVHAMDILNNGGRQALAIAASCCAIALGNRLGISGRSDRLSVAPPISLAANDDASKSSVSTTGKRFSETMNTTAVTPRQGH